MTARDRLRAALVRLRERAAAVRREAAVLAVALRDPRTPAHARVAAFLVAAYALSPIDPLPDVIPVVGFLDELVLLPVGVAVAARLVPDSVLADARARVADAGVPSRLRWAGAAIVVALWLTAAVAVWWRLPG